MKRKVIKLSENTFVVSLPSSFVKKFDVKKGDTLQTDIRDDSIVFYTSNSERLDEIKIDLSSHNDRVIRWLLAALYKKGYDVIQIKLKKNQRAYVMDELNQYTGFTVMDEKENSIIVKSIIHENKEHIHETLRRAFRVTIKMGKELLDALKDGGNTKDVLYMELENNKLVNFCERIINRKVDIETREKTFYYVICWNLEKICDNFKYICNDIEEGLIKNVNKKEMAVFDRTIKFLNAYYDLFYKFDLDKMNSLVEDEKKIKTELKSIKNTSVLSFHLNVCLQQIADMSSSYIALNKK